MQARRSLSRPCQLRGRVLQLTHTSQQPPTMESDRSVYHAYYREKARDLPQAPAKAAREVPALLRDRFATYEEYEEAMADFLNGN